MLNYLWAFMILIGVIFGAINGRIDEVSSAALNSSKEAVTLCITMLGVMSLWTGLMQVASSAGLIRALTNKLLLILHFLFPKIPKGHAANEHIASNVIANVLGLGWAATPAGLKAMESLSELEKERGHNTSHRASNEMCTFLVLNISSLQLIPVNIIAYRSQYGSVNPAAIVGPAIVATLFSTAVGIIFCKLMNRQKEQQL